jgi:hypothetical protein
MLGLKYWSAMAVALLLPAAAMAGDLELSDERNLLGCVVRPEGPPPYPAGFAEEKREAVVRARVSFKSPDEPPSVEVFYNSGLDAFESAVKRYLKQYRLPCMPAGATPVVALQEFRFTPGDGRKVFWSPERPESNPAEALGAESCISLGRGKPSYPWRALNKGQQGTVLAEIRFVGVDQPPEVKILFDGGSTSLAESVRTHVVAAYRMTCVPSVGFPVIGRQSFAFTVSGGTEYSFKDLSLREFVGALKDAARPGTVFDFSSMACPFDVEFRLFQPYATNLVGEIGEVNPNRREFVEWMKTTALNLKSDMLKQLIGRPMKVSVPCGKLDLS